MTWYGHRMMIFGFLRQNLKTQAVAVAFSMAWRAGGVEPGRVMFRRGAGWRLSARELYRCFTARADELFELAEACCALRGR